MKKLLLSLLTLFGAAGLASAQTEPVVLLDADFSVFTNGSEDAPVSLYTSTFKAKVDGFYSCSSVSAAGGKILIGPSGYIETNYFSAIPTTGSSTLRITAEVRMTDDYGGCVQFQPGYGTAVNAMVESDEWTTVSTYVSGFSSTTRLRVSPFLSVNGFYIKTLKIEYSPDFIAAPEAFLPSDADGTSFTAACSRVGNAASYEADVFTLDGDDEPEYVEQNVELKALSTYSNPSAKITGLDPAKTYYYVARAVSATGARSENSDIVKVVRKIDEIAAPEALAASNISEEGFTANWDAVDGAVAYVVNTYEEAVLAAETDVTVFEEDFSGVNVGTFGTVEFSGKLDSYTKIPGWLTDGSQSYANGYFVFSIYSGPTGTVTLPAVDLSANDGKFTVTVNAATARYGNFYTTANTLTVELLDGDDVIETAPAITCDKDDFTDFTFELTKGKADSRLRIVYTLAEIIENDAVKYDPNKLFIDEITISQTLPAGSVVEKQLSSAETAETSLDIKLIPEAGKTYSYAVAAMGETVVGAGSSASIGTIQSAFSDKIIVNFGTSGIDEISSDDSPLAWKAGDGILGVRGSNVAVHDLLGRTLLTKTLPDGSHSLRVNLRGMVIVTVDGKSFKIVL